MARAMQAQSVAELEQSLREYESALRQYVQERPLTSVLAAFAAGYVLGGGLTPRLTWIALTTAGRMTFLNLLRDVVTSVAVPQRPASARVAGPSSAGRSSRR